MSTQKKTTTKKPVKKTTQNQSAPKKRVVKKRRHIRKSVFLVLAVIITAIIIAFFVPRFTSNTKLENLGYNEEEIKAIRKYKLTDTIIENEYYSTYLASSLRNETLHEEYLSLYAVLPDGKELTNRDFLLYGRLQDEGYEEDQCLNLFHSLEFWEMTPLLVFDYQWNEQAYIKDCLANRETNSVDCFLLDGSYRTYYKITTKTPNLDSLDIIVNKTYYVPENYEPKNVREVDTLYAVYNMYLQDEAASAAEKMCQKAVDQGAAFFVSNAYWDFEDITNLYDSYLYNMTPEQVDEICPRPGHSEHETALAMNVSATYESEVAFEETTCYEWLKENSASFGFIERYPINKHDITGMDYEPSHYRYVGEELAKSIKGSHLTFDEYWAMYLKPWYDEQYKPNDEIYKNITEIPS